MRDRQEWRSYVFYVESAGMAKIGSTLDLARREYMLRWNGYTMDTPHGVHEGSVVHSRVMTSKKDAISTERMCQDILHPYVRRVVAAGGRCEWFAVDKDAAIQALDLAADSFFMEFDMDSKILGGLYRVLRSDKQRFGSVAHVVNHILEEHLHELLGAKS